MKRLIISLMAVMLLVWAVPATADTLYAVTQNGAVTPSYLYTISQDLLNYTNLGQIVRPNGKILSIQDIAYNPVDNKMYVISTQALFTIDVQNIIGNNIPVTLVTNQGLMATDKLRGLTVSKDGDIYASSSLTNTASGYLFKYDSVGNTWVNMGSLGTYTGDSTDYMGCVGDLVFGSGNLYGSVNWLNHGQNLATINTGTGAATVIGSFGKIPGKRVSNDGLAFWGTDLIGAFNSNLGVYKVYPTTGSIVPGSFVATGIDFNGLTLAPIPGAVLLLGTGLTCLAALGLRKKS